MDIDLELARRYMAMMADGKNPVTKEYVTEADTVFDTRVQAVCDFIMIELDKLIAQEETDCQVFTPQPSPYPITMRELVRILNSSVASRSNTVRYTTRKIEKWLESIGALRRIKLDGVTYKKMTGYSYDFGVSIDLSIKLPEVRNCIRHRAVLTLLRANVLKPLIKETSHIIVIRRRCSEHLRISKPAHALIALRAVSWYIHKVIALRPQRV